MGALERMVIFPETRSGRMKLRWVYWLTNWITSARSRLSKLSRYVLAWVCACVLSTGAVAGGSVARVAPGAVGAPRGGGAMVFLEGGAGRFSGSGGFTLPGALTPGLINRPRPRTGRLFA